MVKRKSRDGESISKTARASLGQKSKESFQPSGELNQIISLDNGNWCYLRSPVSGALYHLKVGSFAYFDRLDYLRETSYWPQIEKELIGCGFPTVKEEND